MKIFEAGLWSEPSGIAASASALTGGLWSATLATELSCTASALAGDTGAARGARAGFSFLPAGFCWGSSTMDAEEDDDGRATTALFPPRGDVSLEPLDPRDETRLWKRR
jgi:hypothetical protein